MSHYRSNAAIFGDTAITMVFEYVTWLGDIIATEDAFSRRTGARNTWHARYYLTNDNWDIHLTSKWIIKVKIFNVNLFWTFVSFIAIYVELQVLMIAKFSAVKQSRSGCCKDGRTHRVM